MVNTTNITTIRITEIATVKTASTLIPVIRPSVCDFEAAAVGLLEGISAEDEEEEVGTHSDPRIVISQYLSMYTVVLLSPTTMCGSLAIQSVIKFNISGILFVAVTCIVSRTKILAG